MGLAVAIAIGRLLTSLLYETSAFNPLLLSGALAILAASALVACLLPARRATLVDPIKALRVE